jgi:fused signal recognition particle receptor
MGDFGVATTEKILKNLRIVSVQELWKTTDQVIARFKQDVAAFMTLPGTALHVEQKPSVFLIVGVNGSGKTTTIGKMAARLRSEGKRVMVVAGDTFRAAAAEQLSVWAERSGAEFIRGRESADPASVVYDGVVAAKARGIDIVLIDTAGRLQNKTNLMEELKKVRRVIEREIERPPDETLLVIDGTTGQNAISQAKLFHEATALTGIVVTKLDSSSKGGVVIAVVDTIEIPIKLIGIGEHIEALEVFDSNAYVSALLG